MPKYVLLVLTNAADGRDADFNDWYDQRHLPDVLDVPGMISAQRLELAPLQRKPPPYPYRYAAIYNIETDDLAAVMAEMTRRSGTDAMLLSDAMDNDRKAWVYQTLGPEQFPSKSGA